MWKCLISRFVEDMNARQRSSFSFCELRYSPLELNSWKNRQHMTNWKTWNKSDGVWNSPRWRFRSCCRRRCLSSVYLSSPERSLEALRKHAWNVSGYKAWLDYKQMKQLPRWLQHSQWAEGAFFSGQVHSSLAFIPATGHKSSAIKMGYSGQWHSPRGFFQGVEQCLNQIIVLNLFLCAVPSMHKPQYQDLSYSAGDACPLQ